MIVATEKILRQARQGRYAVGAFNVYTLEGARAVVAAAERTRSPAILQVLPKALELGGTALIALCLEAARTAIVPLGVSKFNVNTELRNACLAAGGEYLSGTGKPELVARMEAEIRAMQAPVISKIRRFRSEGKAS